jgi:chorismate mutase
VEKTGIMLAVITLFALDVEAGTQERLEACRHEIDSLDQRLVELIQKRARVVEEVGAIKREAGLTIRDAQREHQVIEKVQRLAKGGPLPAEAVGRIYQKLIEEMRNWEQKLNDAADTTILQPTGDAPRQQIE